MAQLLVMYKTPKDAAAFDKHYFERHVPLAKKIPGLRKYEVSQCPVATPGGPSGYHLVAILQYDNLAAIQNASRVLRGRRQWRTFRISPLGVSTYSCSILAKCKQRIGRKRRASAPIIRRSPFHRIDVPVAGNTFERLAAPIAEAQAGASH